MAYTPAIPSVSKDSMGKIVLTEEGFVADTDASLAWSTDTIYRYATLEATAAHATDVTNTIEAAIQGSVDGKTWTEVVSMVALVDDAPTTTGYGTVVYAADFIAKGFTQYRIYITTIGAGNTCAFVAKIWR